MILKPYNVPDWYTWADPDIDWCRANVELPGVRFEAFNGKLVLRYHISHVPCLPEAAQLEHNVVEQARQRQIILPFENSGLLRSYQFADLQFLKPRKGAILGYEMRVGKQQPIDSKVLTPQGWRTIGSLAVGDFVIGSDGLPKRVLGVFPQGVKPSYRVTFSDHSAVEAGPEHLWTVAYRAGGLRWQEMLLTTEQLRTRPKITVNWDGHCDRVLDLSKTALYLPTMSHPAQLECGVLPLSSYLLGQMIANGDLAYGNQLVCNRLDWEAIHASFIADSVDVGPARFYGNTCHVCIRGVVGAFRDLRLNVLSRDKFIPGAYLRGSIPDRTALLQGLMDGDGSVSVDGYRLTYHTISEQLALDVVKLVEGLGGIASIRKYDRGDEDKPIEYRVRLRVPATVAPFRVPRKRDRYSPGTHAHPVRTVTSVEYVRDVESACIKVDSEDELYVTEHCILTHNTPTACHLHDPTTGPLVVCGPLAARESWREWIDKVLGFPPWCLTGMKDIEAPPDCPAYFCHYNILDAHTKFLATKRIGTLVLDEGHMLQSRGTQWLTAVNSLAFHASKILELTGTPCWNKPKSLWTLLHLITPGAWGTEFVFRKRYADAQPGPHGWIYDGQTNAEELKARLATIMVRRTWAEVAPELPPTTRVIEPVELSGTACAAIEAASMKAVLARGTPNASGYLVTLRRKLAEAKIKPACEIAKRAALDGHKVVLWVWHNEIGEKLTAALPENWAVFRLQSADTGSKREAIVDAFRQTDGPAFLVASMGVGGVALDLSCSDYAIFVELDWTPAVLQQAEMRTFHLSRPHVIVYLHADDPIETRLIEALDVKNAFAKALGLSASEIEREVLLER